MTSFTVFAIVTLAVILAMTNGAPQNGHVQVDNDDGVPDRSNVDLAGSLTKRDLLNHAPIAHHTHSASCFGGGGQGPPPPPPPPPGNSTG